MHLSATHRSLTRLLVAGAIFCLISPAAAGEVNLSAAASLREAVGEVADNYAKQHPGVTFNKNFGASGVLARQIENGAPADLFFAANLEWMDYLKRKGLVAGGNVFTFAHNTLVFVGREGIRADSLSEVVKLERIAIGSPKSVPAGAYALEALRNAGIEKQLQSKLVMARDVRACLLFVERGEVDGAFVYRTDALQAAGKTTLRFTVPQGLYPRVTYPTALTATGVAKGEAAGFFGFLKSVEVKNVLVKYGFAPE
ncbi:MAG: molybdate ABC transporter substrate-binding protein [Syntrophales bacterium]